MADTGRTTYQGPPVTGPGLIFAPSHVSSPSLDDAIFNRWYSTVHVPDVMKTGAVTGAARWRCADASGEGVIDPYLALYKVADLALCQTDEFKAIPMTHELLPQQGEGGKTIHDFADIDTRIYGLVDLREKSKEGSDGYDSTTKIIAAGMQPTSEEVSRDTDRWYREEHDEQMSREPGWIRTTRYKLVFHIRSTKAGGTPRREAPEWMTVHEFGEGNELGDKVKPLVPVSEWTRRIMGQMEFIEGFVWERTDVFKA